MAFDYKKFWQETYETGGTSGAGSYGVLAQFKAEVINGLIRDQRIQTVIEFGCGDGHQLGLMRYEEYLGLDVAQAAVDMCARKFAGDGSKSFMLYEPGKRICRWLRPADLVVCLDVLYHVTDERDFLATLDDVFRLSARIVALYTKITTDAEPSGVDTIQNRDIFRYIERYPFRREVVEQRHKGLSSANFIILERDR